MAAGTYVVCVGIMFISYNVGILRMSFSIVLAWCVAIFLINVIFYIIFRSGLNLLFKEKSLTMPQILVATMIAMVMLFFLEQERGIALLFYIIPLSFGVFRLRLDQFLILSLFAFLCYAISSYLHFLVYPENFNTQIEMLLGFDFAVILVWFSFLGSYFSQIRHMTEIQAIYDDLTSVFNRRQLFKLFEREKALADRRGLKFAVCIFDIDHFKEVNDTFGHLSGDAVLKELAQLVEKNLRNEDYIARYGGEEFVLILSYPEIENAVVAAERIRSVVDSTAFYHKNKTIQITISIGLTLYTPQETIEKTLARVDRALYRAKSEGRNRVKFEPPPS
jgi:diguanylate cyclase (GGDEF)-like protein